MWTARDRTRPMLQKRQRVLARADRVPIIAPGAVHSINRAVSLSKAMRRRKIAKSFSSEDKSVLSRISL